MEAMNKANNQCPYCGQIISMQTIVIKSDNSFLTHEALHCPHCDGKVIKNPKSNIKQFLIFLSVLVPFVVIYCVTDMRWLKTLVFVISFYCLLKTKAYCESQAQFIKHRM